MRPPKIDESTEEAVSYTHLDVYKRQYSHRLFIKILRKQVSNGDAGNVVPIH